MPSKMETAWRTKPPGMFSKPSICKDSNSSMVMMSAFAVVVMVAAVIAAMAMMVVFWIFTDCLPVLLVSRTLIEMCI